MIDVTKLVGLSTGWRKIEYNWRDMALYALAVGADENDLLYTYEKNMKAIPSFGSLPYYNAVNNVPQQPLPYPANYLASDVLDAMAGEPMPKGLHAGFEMIMHRPIDPIKGSLVHNSTVKKVYDRGSKDKGVMLIIENKVHDEAGNLLCTNISHNILRGCGGYGGEKEEKQTIEYPDREPDYITYSYVSKTQNMLYRLTGDTNYVHIDPDMAKAFSDKPFMQGLSSFGFACRMMIKAVIPGEPERMRRMKVQMRSIAFTDTPVQIRVWKVGENKAVFKYIDLNTEKAILDHCVFEWN